MLSEQLASVVETLKYHFDDHALNQLISKSLGANARAKDIFAIKYEIQRLAKPCNRAIDFRFRAGNIQVAPFSVGNFTHYLDEHSIRYFSQVLAQYKGHYCEGVYELVEEHYKENKRHIKELQTFQPKPIELVTFRKVHSRSEERLFLSKMIDVYPLAGNDLQSLPEGFPTSNPPPISMRTANLSREGLKIRGEASFPIGQLIAVRFVEFEQEFVFKAPYLIYQVVSKPQAESHTFNLKLYDKYSNPELEGFLQRTIQNYKTRNNVDIEHLYYSIRLQGFAQHKSISSRGIHLCINQSNDVEYTLMSYNGTQTLSDISEKDWLSPLLERDKVVDYSMTSGPFFYFVANCTDASVAKEGLYGGIVRLNDKSFPLLSFFTKRGLGQLFYVDFTKASNWEHFSLSAIKNIKSNKRANDQLNGLADTLLATIKGVVTLQPLSIDICRLLLQISEQSSSALKTAGGMTQERLLSLPEYKSAGWLITNEYEKRKEQRFPFSGKITLMSRNRPIIAQLKDVSISGASCELMSNEKCTVSTNEKLKVSFDELRQRVSKFDLSNTYYRVIEHRGSTLRLQLDQDESQDIGRFWRAFLNMRLKKLGDKVAPVQPIGLKSSLSACHVSHNSEFMMTFQLLNSRPVFQQILMPQSPAAFWREEGSQKINNLFVFPTIFNYFKKHSVTGCSLLVRVQYLENNDVKSCQIIEQQNLVSVAKTLAKSKGQSKTRLLAITHQTTDTVDMAFFGAGLRYIKRFSPHRYEELVQEINITNGLLSVVDLTDTIASFVASK